MNCYQLESMTLTRNHSRKVLNGTIDIKLIELCSSYLNSVRLPGFLAKQINPAGETAEAKDTEEA